jgi:hypothetical protein
MLLVLERAVEPIYLQTKDGTWHWREDCARYPSLGEIAGTRRERPTPDDLCDECQALDESGIREA